jgi:hypothetical protein
MDLSIFRLRGTGRAYNRFEQMATEKELDRALEVALRNDKHFLEWLVNKSKFKGRSPEYVWSRSDNPWCPVEVSLPDPGTGQLRSIKREGETDVLLVFVFPNEPRRRLALHIENKLSSGKFTDYQPEVYSARAKLWLRKPKYRNYEDWDTLLLAPVSFYDRYEIDARKFGCFVSHEEVAEFVPLFRAATVLRVPKN